MQFVNELRVYYKYSLDISIFNTFILNYALKICIVVGDDNEKI